MSGSVVAHPTFREAARFWVRLGFISFGGPTGQIAIMHEELVERRRWIGEDRFLHALSYCMLLPGPEAQQLAIYIGWLLHGTPGGIFAGVTFVLPAFFLLLGLSWTYAAHGQLPAIAAVLDGLSAAVVGIVFAATIAIGRRTLRTRPMWVVAGVVFITIFIVGVPFPIVILGAGAAGLLLGDVRPAWFPQRRDADETPVGTAAAQGRVRPSLRRTVRVLLVGLAVWWLPIALVVGLTGVGSVYSQEALFFSQVAVVTFGGAYAVLAYVGREVIARFGLTAGDVVAGLGLAETTPGPLILVLEFLGFLAAYRNPGDLPPLAAGMLGATVTVWATFAPCFLWIFLGAPSVERLRDHARLRAALTTITAAVVGVVASLALTVAAVVLFDDVGTVEPFRVAIPVPHLASLDGFHAVVAAVTFVGMVRLGWNVVWIVLGSGGAGLLWSAVR